MTGFDEILTKSDEIVTETEELMRFRTIILSRMRSYTMPIVSVETYEIPQVEVIERHNNVTRKTP